MMSDSKSRSTDDCAAFMEMIDRGGSAKSSTLPQPSPRNRRCRGANRHALARPDVLTVDAGDVPAPPTFNVRMDPYTRMILGFEKT